MMDQCGFSEKWRKWFLIVFLFFYSFNFVNAADFLLAHGFREEIHLVRYSDGKALSRMEATEIDGRYLNGFIVGSIHNGVLMISHIFVDGTLIFCKTELD